MQILTNILLLTFVLYLNTGTCQTTVFSTDFETGIPAVFTIVDNDGLTPNADVSEYTSAWISLVDPEDNSNSVASSTSYFDPSGTASRWLISPALTLGSFGNFVSWTARSHDASFPDDYLVLVSNTTTELSSFTDTIGNVMEENADWTYRSVNLSSEGYNDQTIHIAFVNVTEDGFKLYLDSLNVWKEDPVGVSDIANTMINVYPNPFNASIKIEASEYVHTVILSDGTGRILQVSNENVLETQHLPSGTYFVEVQTQVGSYVRKMLKP